MHHPTSSIDQRRRREGVDLVARDVGSHGRHTLNGWQGGCVNRGAVSEAGVRIMPRGAPASWEPVTAMPRPEGHRER